MRRIHASKRVGKARSARRGFCPTTSGKFFRESTVHFRDDSYASVRIYFIKQRV